MTISETGKITWPVPKDYPTGVKEMSVHLQSATGRVADHRFSVRVEE
jgi:hypothetical protein